MRPSKIAHDNYHYKKLLAYRSHNGKHCNCGVLANWKKKRKTKWRGNKLPFEKDDIVYWSPFLSIAPLYRIICRITGVIEYRDRGTAKNTVYYELEKLQAAPSTFFGNYSRSIQIRDSDSLSLAPPEEAALFLLGK